MDTLPDLASLDFLRGRCVVGIFIDVVMGSQMILIRSERSLSSSTGRDVQGTSLFDGGTGHCLRPLLGGRMHLCLILVQRCTGHFSLEGESSLCLRADLDIANPILLAARLALR